MEPRKKLFNTSKVRLNKKLSSEATSSSSMDISEDDNNEDDVSVDESSCDESSGDESSADENEPKIELDSNEEQKLGNFVEYEKFLESIAEKDEDIDSRIAAVTKFVTCKDKDSLSRAKFYFTAEFDVGTIKYFKLHHQGCSLLIAHPHRRE